MSTILRTDAQNHRLILNYMHLVPMVASGFRGARGIPLEELEGAGRVGLCEAARDWKENCGFEKFAYAGIRNNIRDFIRTWDAPLDHDDQHIGKERSFYEWQTWSDREYIYAISEHWTKLPVSPEDIALRYEEIKHAGQAIQSSLIGFSKRERSIFHDRFLTDVPLSIETIARKYRISYSKTVRLLDGMLRRIRETLEARLAA